VLSALFCSDNDLFTESARGNSNTPLRHSLSFAVGSFTAADFRKSFWNSVNICDEMVVHENLLMPDLGQH
jgi:hypothetical protein